jgi:hypothetical protein
MRTKWLIATILTTSFTFAQACGGDDDSTATGGAAGGAAGTGTVGTAGTGTGGSGTGTAGSAAGATAECSPPMVAGSNITNVAACSGAAPYADQTCVNAFCFDVAKGKPPLNEHGDCCKRVDLVKANECKSPEQRVYEHRVMSGKFITQTTTLGDPSIEALLKGNFNNKSFVTLWRVTGDLSKEGPVTFEGGPGLYKCDGTYSFYGDGVATATGWSTDPSRYKPTTVKVTWYPEGRISSVKEDRPKLTNYQPIYNYDKADFPIAYEMPVMNYMPLKFPISADKPDCAGTRKSESDWDFVTNAASYEAYLPVFAADKVNKILFMPSPDQTLCQVAAFGLLPVADVTTKTCTSNRCDKTVDPSCVWKEIPDSLCADTPEGIAISPCHLGDRKKTAEAKTICDSQAYTDIYPKEFCELMAQWPEPCSLTPPATLNDTPQCCDPLAQGTDGLPPCNAFRVVQSAILASVEITDQPSTTPAIKCPVK